MTEKDDDGPYPIIPRMQARQDVEDIVDYLTGEAGLRVALNFIDAYEAACRTLSANPAIGSTRIGYELDLPGLRSWPVKGFGHLIFYEAQDGYIDVWRILHGARDLPLWLVDSEGPASS